MLKTAGYSVLMIASGFTNQNHCVLVLEQSNLPFVETATSLLDPLCLGRPVLNHSRENEWFTRIPFEETCKFLITKWGKRHSLFCLNKQRELVKYPRVFRRFVQKRRMIEIRIHIDLCYNFFWSETSVKIVTKMNTKHTRESAND